MGQREHDVTRQISMTTRKELVEALRVRYSSAAREDRIKILDEFVALNYRKHAIRLLCEQLGTAADARSRTRLYDGAVRQALTMLWGSGRSGMWQAAEGADSGTRRCNGVARAPRS
jgi:hypothetical protein